MQFNSSQHRSNRVKSYCVAIVSDLMLSSNQSYDNQYLLNFLLTYDFGLYENLGADTLRNHPHAMKASMTHDPDNPWLHEAMSGEHRYYFLAAIGK